MRSSFLRAAVLLALMASSAIAAAEAPARVGRLSLVQGPVSISTDDGEGQSDALINWPVTTENRIVTERGARTEIRVGSTAVRLDGDSSLDVIELDDDSLRLHLNYGSASVRVRNPEVLEGFEIGTPHGRVTLREPGRIRVDAERQRDASTVDVFEGVAVVDSAGSRLSVRAGRRAEMHPDHLGTAFAQRTGFDDWAALRDRQDDRAVSDRYVTSEMTGYEELDRYGSWRDDSEYGPLWAPRGLPSNWAPYRDGRWTWVAPWGWTWIDNAPWGYAPSHYGRWVMVNHRWHWAPGRNIGRPVWAPALVGWVGGSNWSLSFGSGSLHRPAQGWYPLGPHDVFVPGYRSSHDHVRYINRHARNDGDRRRHRGDHRRQGLTVVPHEHFNRRVPVVVPQAPRAVVTPSALQAAPALVPSAPPQLQRDRLRRHADDRRQHDGVPRERRPVQTAAPAAVPAQPAPAMQAPQPPALTVQQQPMRDQRMDLEARRQWRMDRDAGRRERMEQEAQRSQLEQEAQRSRMEQASQRSRMEQEAQRSRMQQEAQRSQMEQEAQRARMEQEAQRQSRMQLEAQRQWRMEQDARRQWQGARDERRIQVEQAERSRAPQPAPVAVQQPAPQPAPAPQIAPERAQQEASPAQEHRRQLREERREHRRQGVNVNLE